MNQDLDLKYWIKEVYYWQYSNTGCFNNLLFSLIHKADAGNQSRLSEGFPLALMAYKLWRDTPDPAKFFKEFFKGEEK